MFVLGGFAEERTVPVGASFPERGMRNDQHDAVAAQLMIPIRPGDAPPAAGGAPQPAEAASHAEQNISPAAGGAPQPAEAPSDAEQPTWRDCEATDAEQDTPEQGVSGGQLCAVSIEGDAPPGPPLDPFYRHSAELTF